MAGCGAFAILAGGGPWTLLLGQPTGFALLGLAVTIRARRPWVAALGFMLVASTIQTGLPVALALIALGAWPVVWRGAVMVAAWSLPPVVVAVVHTGLPTFARAFVHGGAAHLSLLSNRIDLGALLQRAGVGGTVVPVAAGVLVLVLTLLFLVRLPARVRRIDYPPVLCLVVAATLLCAYHQPYDMLLVADAVIPVVLLTGGRSMLPVTVFALAGIGVAVTADQPVAVIADPVCLMAIAGLGVLAARREAAPDAAGRDPAGGGGEHLAIAAGAREPIEANPLAANLNETGWP